MEKSTNGVNWQIIHKSFDNPAKYIVDNSLDCSLEPFYRVRAYNGNGVSSPSASLKVKCGPNAPINLTATPAESQITLNWQDVSDDETSFQVQRLNGTTWVNSGISLAANTITFNDASVSCGQDYSYRVSANNSSGTNYSTQLNTGTLPCDLTPSATALSQSRLRINWTGSPNGTGFVVERREDGETTFTILASYGPGITSHEDYPLTCDLNYTYRISTSNAWGDKNSQLITAPDSCGPPRKPSGLFGNGLSITAIQLEWDDVPDDETGYKIERSLDNLNWDLLPVESGPGYVLAQNTTNFKDGYWIGLPKPVMNTAYYYRVIAANAFGDSTPSESIQLSTYEHGIFMPLMNFSSPLH
ncbi:MAG: fibronectin type III domain-containing protein [Anaerolineaceae bacterium]|nr:fibronectin type III domain-containing protein [Anaerolineaceae bacterium]